MWWWTGKEGGETGPHGLVNTRGGGKTLMCRSLNKAGQTPPLPWDAEAAFLQTYPLRGGRRQGGAAWILALQVAVVSHAALDW